MKNGYILKVELNGIRPPIWRRLAIPSGITLADLQVIIELSMGWVGGHLHSFEINGREYGNPESDDEFDGIDENETIVDHILKKRGTKFKYVYDFGDYWVHTITYERESEEKIQKPKVLKGKRACPPEDCGGVWGYAKMLEVIADKNHKEHKEMLDWLNEDFDPEIFDLEEVNIALAGEEVQPGIGAGIRVMRFAGQSTCHSLRPSLRCLTFTHSAET